MDPRHKKRIDTVQNLFAYSFKRNNDNFVFPNKDSAQAEEIINNIDEINSLISKYAPKYPLEKVAVIDKSILQLAVFELKFATKKEPKKVVINEAVEIAKELGNDRSFAFVNAVLGAVNEEIEKKKK